MTLDFEADDVACLPGKHSQVARLLRALACAGYDGRPVAVKWDRQRRIITVPGRGSRGGGGSIRALHIHDSELTAAERAGWIAAAADPPNGTWLLTQSGRQLLEALS